MVALEDVKNYLGISGTDHDVFLSLQVSIISEAIEGYCNRRFSLSDYEQTFYAQDFLKSYEVLLYHFPVTQVSSVVESSTEDNWTPITGHRVHKPSGTLSLSSGFFKTGKILKVSYSAGFSEIPAIISHVLLSLIQERFNKRSSGVDLNFGSDVQRISIPGAISIDFDYSLNQNERKSAYGVLLGNYLNVLDPFRSERTISGSSKLAYVEEVP